MTSRLAEMTAVACAVVCALGIRLLQTPLTERLRKVHLSDDTTALPPPKQLRAMTFGYHAAAADILWATLIVEHGLHSEEKRAFRGVTRYLDGILELEPEHKLLYDFVDTLLVYKPGELGTEDDARSSRAYLERGTRERPYDHDVWLHYGQFLAFLAPTFLKDEGEIERWRKDGAFAIARAVELGADADRSLAASTLLSKAGETKAATQQLERAYALTDNPDTRNQILLKLQHLKANSDVEGAVTVVEHQWRSRYPFMSRAGALLLGPYRSPAACAGPNTFESKACAPDWTTATENR